MKKLLFTLLILVLSVAPSLAQNGNNWSKKNYSVQGDWAVETKDGVSYLVLKDNFKTRKGPDLKLFLTKKSSSTIGKNEAVETHGTFLANLKSYKGKQSYKLPPNIKLSDFKSIVIHCEKYTKVWAASAI